MFFIEHEIISRIAGESILEGWAIHMQNFNLARHEV